MSFPVSQRGVKTALCGEEKPVNSWHQACFWSLDRQAKPNSSPMYQQPPRGGHVFFLVGDMFGNSLGPCGVNTVPKEAAERARLENLVYGQHGVTQTALPGGGRANIMPEGNAPTMLSPG